MNRIKVIKTEKDYQEALELAKVLLDSDPDPESEEGERLDLIITLIEDYESKILPESLPDPIDAILFRMEQENLKPIDLVPYLGTRSKVSEVLSRKRPLTLSMIRALETGLGIPAKVLLQESNQPTDFTNIMGNKSLLKEMVKRGYFGKVSLKDSNIAMLIDDYFSPIGREPSTVFGMLRKSNYVRASRPMDRQALFVWSSYVIKKAKNIEYPISFKKETIDLKFMQSVAKLSADSDGPIIAEAFLKNAGIGLVIEPHFPKTYLDGAVIMTDKKHPIIGLTLRHDRVDNFWFTLMHELAHISLHCDTNIDLFYDDLDNPDSNEMETQADRLAGEALIPRSKWENSPARLIPSPIAAESLARELGIHTAIVAGKMRYEGGRYQYLNTIINQAKVRKYFPHIEWRK